MVGEGHSLSLGGEIVGVSTPLFTRWSESNSLARLWPLRRRFPDRGAAQLLAVPI
jgi:hypothetical protein